MKHADRKTPPAPNFADTLAHMFAKSKAPDAIKWLTSTKAKFEAQRDGGITNVDDYVASL